MLLGGQGYPRFKINACRRVKTTVKRYGRTNKITDQKSCYGLIFLKIREAAGSDVLDGVCPITEGKPVPMRLVQRHARVDLLAVWAVLCLSFLVTAFLVEI